MAHSDRASIARIVGWRNQAQESVAEQVGVDWVDGYAPLQPHWYGHLEFMPVVASVNRTTGELKVTTLGRNAHARAQDVHNGVKLDCLHYCMHLDVWGGLVGSVGEWLVRGSRARPKRARMQEIEQQRQLLRAQLAALAQEEARLDEA